MNKGLKDLDDELKKAEIAKIFATIRIMKEDSQRANKMWKEECRRWRIEREEERKQRKLENERMQRESDARIAKYEAEIKNLKKNTLYYPLVSISTTIAAAITTLASIFR